MGYIEERKKIKLNQIEIRQPKRTAHPIEHCGREKGSTVLVEKMEMECKVKSQLDG